MQNCRAISETSGVWGKCNLKDLQWFFFFHESVESPQFLCEIGLKIQQEECLALRCVLLKLWKWDTISLSYRSLSVHGPQLTRDLGRQHFHTLSQAICEYVHMSGNEAVLLLPLLHWAKSNYSQTDIASGSYGHVFIWICAKVRWMRGLWDPNAGDDTRATNRSRDKHREQKYFSTDCMALIVHWLYSFREVVWSLTTLLVLFCMTPINNSSVIAFASLRWMERRESNYTFMVSIWFEMLFHSSFIAVGQISWT